MPSEEVEGHPRPTGASRDQSPANVERSHCNREARVLDVPEPEEFTRSSDDDKKFNRDSHLSPRFFGHAEIVAWRST